MPEEINRTVTYAITKWSFTTGELATENLRRSGVRNERIFLVGNTNPSRESRLPLGNYDFGRPRRREPARCRKVLQAILIGPRMVTSFYVSDMERDNVIRFARTYSTFLAS